MVIDLILGDMVLVGNRLVPLFIATPVTVTDAVSVTITTTTIAIAVTVTIKVTTTATVTAQSHLRLQQGRINHCTICTMTGARAVGSPRGQFVYFFA